MKKKTSVSSPTIWALLAAFVVFVSACYNEFPFGDVTRVYLDPPEVVLWLGHPDSSKDEVTLIARLHPLVVRDEVGVRWDFDGDSTGLAIFDPVPSVTFDANGMTTARIVAESDGVVYVTIYVYDDDDNVIASALCRITVMIYDGEPGPGNGNGDDTNGNNGDNNSVTGVKINGNPSPGMAQNEIETFVAIIEPSNATNQGLTWVSSNRRVLSVTPNYGTTVEVKAVGPGTATIFVTTDDGGYRASHLVTVTAGS